MDKYEKLLEEYKKSVSEKELKTRFQPASYKEKAKLILLNEFSAARLGILAISFIALILANMFLNPPMLFHADNCFEVITHPLSALKQMYFGWGDGGSSFIFSLTGLKHYFTSIIENYRQFGVLTSTFAYLTQFSPVWGFLPLYFIFRWLFSFLEIGYLAQIDDLAKFLEEKESKLNKTV